MRRDMTGALRATVDWFREPVREQEPVREAEREPVHEPEREPVREQEPVREASPEPVREPGPEPVREAGPELVPEPEPVDELVREPARERRRRTGALRATVDWFREPVREPKPVREPEPEPVDELVRDPVREAEREPVHEPGPEPVREAGPELVPEPEPVDELVREPVRERRRATGALRATVDWFREPVREQEPEPVPGPGPEPVHGLVREPAREPGRAPVRELAPQPVREPEPQPVHELVREPERAPVRDLAPGRVRELVLEPAPEPAERAVTVEQPRAEEPPGSRWRGRPTGKHAFALAFALVSGFATHAWHLFEYPLYTTDEGIYMQRAWSLIHETRLSPYTYTYDHAPAGWIALAGWVLPLPHQFELFGNAMNTGRVFMLLIHVASVYLLFEIALWFSNGLLAPSITCFFFNFSPIAVYFQRQVLLDNIMVFWLLLSIYLLQRFENRIFGILWAGLAFGLAVVTKENAIFFAPTIGYIMYRGTRGSQNRHFAASFWVFAVCTPVAAYVLYSVLKNELLPAGMDFNLRHPPAQHVSLLYEVVWQLHRNQGTLLSHGSFLYTSWLPKDRFLLEAGIAAMLVNLLLGWQWRHQERGLRFLVAGTLAFEIAFYLARGSVILDFYVIPLIPLLALNIGLLLDWVLKRAKPATSRVAIPVVTGLLAALLLLPSGGYLLVHGRTLSHRLQPPDIYFLPQTYMQNEEVRWVRQHIPPTARIITDDDIWMALHDVKPYYPYAQSHYTAAADPIVRNKLFHSNWQNIDYIVMSNQMRRAMIINNGGGQENWILTALNHSQRVWSISRGDVQLQIYQVEK